jgi:hypothetical protein
MGVLSIKTLIMLKKIYFVIAFLFFLFIFNSCDFQGKSEIDVIFEQTKKIEILAYLERGQWDRLDNPDYLTVNYIKNRKLDIKEKYLRNRIVLNDNQIKILKKELGNCKTENWEAMCYMPRHAILFYNENDEISGYIEVCFQCNGSDSSPNLKFLSKCALRQKELFKEFGITYFNETKEEKE